MYIEMEFCLPYIEANKKSWREYAEEEGGDRMLRHNSSGNDSGVIGKQPSVLLYINSLYIFHWVTKYVLIILSYFIL